jgi:hypothetical protein
MNLQRVAAIIGISGAVLGGASIITIGAAAYLVNQAAEAAQASSIDDGAESSYDIEPEPDTGASATGWSAPIRDALPTGSRDPGTGTMDPDYNPYLEPTDPEYVTPEERSEWLGQQVVIRECMADAGFDYLDWHWWLGGSPQPRGLDYETSVLWTKALYGPDIYMPGGGCADVGVAAAEAARAAGTPLSAPVPPDDLNQPTERQTWLLFQDEIRDCMAGAGHEYLYWEWWNPVYQSVDFSAEPAMPQGLSEEQKAAWTLALFGDAGGGAAYRWEDAGCSGYATHVTGNDNMH